MEYSVEKLSGNKVKITFTAPAADFEEAVQKAYLKVRGQISVPGFRKGKAPRRLIESMYGSAVFYDDALEILFPDAYTKAVTESGINPVSRPEVDVETIEKGKDVVFTAEVFVMPEVKLGDYKGLEVTKHMHPVTDEQIDARLDQERKKVARSIEVTDRALENGDNAELDYSGSVDGVKFEGGTAEHQHLVIGSGSFIPGFEEQMIGMQVGEERDLNVQFPEKYHSEDLAGKNAVFHVKLHAITKEELPELDDDFASEVSDFDTLAEYRADVAKKIEETASAHAEEAAKQQLVDKAVANAEVDIPAPMVENKLDDMMQEMGWRMQQQGFSMEQYLQMLGQTPAQMRDMYRSEAELTVKTELVLDEIVKAEGIEAGDEDVDKLLAGYAEPMGQTVEQMKKSFNEGQIEYFKHRAAVTKALDLMWDAAKVTEEVVDHSKEEKDEEEEKKPAKKRTTKKAKAEEAPAAEGEADAEEAPAKPKRTRKTTKKAEEAPAEEPKAE
ncbi:MAG: trigger factor [Clostridiales bacterium]|nr:trigger factor [Clostridiales bacterium]